MILPSSKARPKAHISPDCGVPEALSACFPEGCRPWWFLYSRSWCDTPSLSHLPIVSGGIDHSMPLKKDFQKAVNKKKKNHITEKAFRLLWSATWPSAQNKTTNLKRQNI